MQDIAHVATTTTGTTNASTAEGEDNHAPVSHNSSLNYHPNMDNDDNMDMEIPEQRFHNTTIKKSQFEILHNSCVGFDISW